MAFENMVPLSRPEMNCDARDEWLHRPNYAFRPEAVPPTLLGVLELREGLERDLVRIKSRVLALESRQPVDLPTILRSLRYPDRLVRYFLSPLSEAPATPSRFDRQRLLNWMLESSVAGQDAIYSSVTLMRGIRDADLRLLLILERYEQDTRMAIHLLDEHLLDCEPHSVQEACGLLTFIGGLLAADTTIEYSVFATLVVECVRTIEADTAISTTASETKERSILASRISTCAVSNLSGFSEDH